MMMREPRAGWRWTEARRAGERGGAVGDAVVHAGERVSRACSTRAGLGAIEWGLCGSLIGCGRLFHLCLRGGRCRDSSVAREPRPGGRGRGAIVELQRRPASRGALCRSSTQARVGERRAPGPSECRTAGSTAWRRVGVCEPGVVSTSPNRLLCHPPAAMPASVDLSSRRRGAPSLASLDRNSAGYAPSYCG